MEETLSSLVTWGYVAISFFSLAGSLVIVAAVGVFASLGKIDLVTALSVAALFNFLGDILLFYLARYQRQAIMPYFKNHTRKLALSHLMFKRYGSFVIFVKKYIYGLKTLIPLSMGLSKYPFWKFAFYNFFASIIFVTSIGLSGYYASGFIIRVFDKVSDNPWIAPLILFSVLGTIWYFLEKATKR